MSSILSKSNLNADNMKNNVAAINTGAFALGSIIGPILGSFINEYFGYKIACMTIAGLVFVFIALMICANYMDNAN